MKDLDFDYDVNELQSLVSRTAYSYKRATAKYIEILNSWNELGQTHFNGEIALEIDQENAVVEGIISGQKFKIFSMVFYQEKDAHLQASLVISETAPTKEVEIGKFLVAQNGSIHARNGKKVLDHTDDLRDYKLLAAVVRRVLGITDRDE